jgi:transposase
VGLGELSGPPALPGHGFVRRIGALTQEVFHATYAPELNPAEGVWRWLKRGLTNIAALGVDHLADLVTRRLRACRQQTDLLASTDMTLDPELPQ